jgi:hypothetical protein
VKTWKLSTNKYTKMKIEINQNIVRTSPFASRTSGSASILPIAFSSMTWCFQASESFRSAAGLGKRSLRDSGSHSLTTGGSSSSSRSKKPSGDIRVSPERGERVGERQSFERVRKKVKDRVSERGRE